MFANLYKFFLLEMACVTRMKMFAYYGNHSVAM